MTFDVALNRLLPAATVLMHQSPNPGNPVNPGNPAHIIETQEGTPTHHRSSSKYCCDSATVADNTN